MNTHYGLILGSVPPSAKLICSGPESFCREKLDEWIRKFPLQEYERAEIVKRVETVS